MIGSHDTFTYNSSTNIVYNLFTRLWRTQCNTIKEQYDSGVRFFDIRVCWHRGKWSFCHGLARLNTHQFESLDDICEWMETCFPAALYRIVLERGSIKEFLRQAAYSTPGQTDKLCYKYPNLWRVDIKKHGKWSGEVDNNDLSLYNRGYKFAISNTWEVPSRELHGKVTLKNFATINMKKEAEKYNTQLGIFSDPNALKLAERSKEFLYLLDYCTGEYDD